MSAPFLRSFFPHCGDYDPILFVNCQWYLSMPLSSIQNWHWIWMWCWETQFRVELIKQLKTKNGKTNNGRATCIYIFGREINKFTNTSFNIWSTVRLLCHPTHSNETKTEKNQALIVCCDIFISPLVVFHFNCWSGKTCTKAHFNNSQKCFFFGANTSPFLTLSIFCVFCSYFAFTPLHLLLCWFCCCSLMPIINYSLRYDCLVCSSLQRYLSVWTVTEWNGRNMLFFSYVDFCSHFFTEIIFIMKNCFRYRISLRICTFYIIHAVILR